MQYTKPPLSYEQQADQLINRGLIADRETLILSLKRISYYRLSGYLYPFRQEDDSYQPGTTLETICSRYTFDRQLRLLVLDAIERVEVAIRTDLVYEFVHMYGPFGYCESTNLPKLLPERHQRFVNSINKEKKNSHEVFVKHFNSKYGEQHELLPLWMAAEIMSYGTMVTFFNGVDTKMKQKIAAKYKVSSEVLKSWLGTLNAVRNICAHHGRLWNKELGFKPFIPRKNKNPQWHEPIIIPDSRIFGILTILKYMRTFVAPKSKWPDRLDDLLANYPKIPREPMGFPENWKVSPLWK